MIWGVIQCTCLRMAYNSKIFGLKVKWSKVFFLISFMVKWVCFYSYLCTSKSDLVLPMHLKTHG